MRFFEIVLLLISTVVLAGSPQAEDFLEEATDLAALDLPNAAIDKLDLAIEIDPEFSEAFSFRAALHAQQGEVDLAFSDFDRALELSPSDPDILYRRAQVYSLLGRHAEAVVELTTLIEMVPDAVVFNARGKAYQDLEEIEHALSDFNRAIVLDSQVAEYYLNRGTALYETSPIDCVMNCTMAIELDPEYFDAYFNRAVGHFSLQNHQHAVNDLNIAIDLRQDMAQAYYYRGMAHGFLNNFLEAIDDLSLAIELDSDQYSYYFDRGYAFELTQQTELALDDYDMAISMNPGYAPAHFYKGMIYRGLEQWEPAAAAFRKAAEADPLDARCHFVCGEAETELGNLQQAEIDFQKAYELRPDLRP